MSVVVTLAACACPQRCHVLETPNPTPPFPPPPPHPLQNVPRTPNYHKLLWHLCLHPLGFTERAGNRDVQEVRRGQGPCLPLGRILGAGAGMGATFAGPRCPGPALLARPASPRTLPA